MVPPEAKSYQSTVKPEATVAEIDAIDPVEQYVLLPPLLGAATVGQLQLGAVTASVLMQEVEAVKVILVPAGIPDTVQLLPLVFTTVPEVLVNVPALKLTLIDQEERSEEQTGELAIAIVGKGFTVTLSVAVVAHCPAVGVNV